MTTHSGNPDGSIKAPPAPSPYRQSKFTAVCSPSCILFVNSPVLEAFHKLGSRFLWILSAFVKFSLRNTQRAACSRHASSVI